jgi:hypothetical protein
MEYILGLASIALSIWMLRASYKEQRSEFGVTNDRQFIFGMIWLFMWLYILINGLTLIFLGATPALYLRPW